MAPVDEMDVRRTIGNPDISDMTFEPSFGLPSFFPSSGGVKVEMCPISSAATANDTHTHSRRKQKAPLLYYCENDARIFFIFDIP